MGATDISVIVRSCGRPELLVRALASIRAQTLPPAEIVMVAIGAEGKTAVDSVAENTALRVIVVEAGRVRGAALNDGIKLAHGPWYAFLDDDDTWNPLFLEQMMAAVSGDNDNPRVGGAVCQTELVYERYRAGVVENCGGKPLNPCFKQVEVREMAEANQFTINAALWHERVFSAGTYREDLNLLEDWEFNMRAARSFEIKVVPRPLARYHRRPPDDPLPNTQRRTNDQAARALQDAWRRDGIAIGGGGNGPAFFADGWRSFKRAFIRVGSSLRWRFR
ncbi:MAG TPA: glycosyltransferase family A protein [Lacunisphaera sp.]|jgi:glycosyltransferase involved in cell wall biosynthesis